MAKRGEYSLDEIREQVLVAAERLVSESGVKALKARNLALEIDYTVGTIYRVFSSMEDLLQQLNLRTFSDLQIKISSAVKAIKGKPAIIAIINEYANFSRCHFNRWRLLFNPEQQSDVAECLKQQAWLMGQFEEQIRYWQPNYSAQQTKRLAQVIWYGLHGACILDLATHQSSQEKTDCQLRMTLMIEALVMGCQEG